MKLPLPSVNVVLRMKILFNSAGTVLFPKNVAFNGLTMSIPALTNICTLLWPAIVLLDNSNVVPGL